MGTDLSKLVGILVSHEHSDHIQGVPVTAGRHRIPLFLNKATHEEILRRRDFQVAAVEHLGTGETVSFNGLAVRTFSVPHDAADPVGFLVTWEGRRLGVVTDVGHVTHLLEERLRECDVLVIEANHDVPMLDAGPYPPELKRRIKGKNGHLSNHQCCELLQKLYHPGMTHVVLAHLSETNNTPLLAYAAACRCLTAVEKPPRIAVASPSRPSTIRLPRREKEDSSR